MENAPLKPCPFCGGPAIRMEYSAGEADENAGSSYITCEKCDASTALHFDRKENLESDWNRRAGFDFVSHLERQRSFSLATFGPGMRTAGVIDHIRKELQEVEAQPTALEEWVDVILLALDGAWRAGHEPAAIAAAIAAKQAKNECREWPDWRTAPADKAIEHKKTKMAVPRTSALLDRLRRHLSTLGPILSPGRASPDNDFHFLLIDAIDEIERLASD